MTLQSVDHTHAHTHTHTHTHIHKHTFRLQLHVLNMYLLFELWVHLKKKKQQHVKLLVLNCHKAMWTCSKRQGRKKHICHVFADFMLSENSEK